MFPELQILIVEDNRQTAVDLEMAVTEEFSDALVDVAATAEKARDYCEQVDLNARYDVIIMDTKLPLDDSPSPPQVYACDLRFVKDLIDNSGGTFMVFMSAHVKDSKVREFMNRCNAPTQAHTMFVEKDIRGKWIGEILQWLKTTVYSRRVRAGLDRLFVGARSGRTAAAFAANRAGADNIDAGQMILGLAHDVATHWADLDVETKRLVERYYNVVVDGKKVWVTAL